MRRHGNPSRRKLEKLLSAAGSPLAEFEALRIGATSAAQVLVSAASFGSRLGTLAICSVFSFARVLDEAGRRSGEGRSCSDRNPDERDR